MTALAIDRVIRAVSVIGTVVCVLFTVVAAIRGRVIFMGLFLWLAVYSGVTVTRANEAIRNAMEKVRS